MVWAPNMPYGIVLEEAAEKLKREAQLFDVLLEKVRRCVGRLGDERLCTLAHDTKTHPLSHIRLDIASRILG